MFGRLKMVVLVATLVFLIVGCSVLDPSDSKVYDRKPGKQQSEKTYAVKKISGIKDPFDHGFIGIWMVAGSSAEFIINLKNGFVIFSGKDLEDQEQFQVQFIQWDESTFKGSFLMPSTSHATIVNLSVFDDNRLRCKYSGDAKGESIWWRK